MTMPPVQRRASPAFMDPHLLGSDRTMYEYFYLLCFHKYASNLINSLFLQADYMRDDADNGIVARLLGRVPVATVWVRHVLRILGRFGVEVPDPPCSSDHRRPEDAVPQVSLGVAVLAATYKGLCTGVGKGTSSKGIFLGCPLLLHL